MATEFNPGSATDLNDAVRRRLDASSAQRHWLHLQADYTLTSTTSVQKLFNASANGALTLPTGLFEFDAILYLTSMDTTSGNGSFSLLGAGTATLARILYGVWGMDASTPLVVNTRSGVGAITEATAAAMITASAGTGLFAHVAGQFDVTVTGTIIPSIGLANAAAAVVKAGSHFRCQRIGATATAASSSAS